MSVRANAREVSLDLEEDGKSVEQGPETETTGETETEDRALSREFRRLPE